LITFSLAFLLLLGESRFLALFSKSHRGEDSY
jgi:hypothetical protein